MAETTREVDGFKNSVLGKVFFKIASIAGLQEALNGKAAVSHTHTKSQITDFPTIDSAPANDAGHLISSKGVYDALYKTFMFDAIYESKTATSLASFSTRDTLDRVGVFAGHVLVQRVKRSGQNPETLNLNVVVHIFSATSVQVYLNNSLFAHLSGETWIIDYSGQPLIPIIVDPEPELDLTQHIKIDSISEPGAPIASVNLYFWYAGQGSNYTVWASENKDAKAAVEGGPELNEKVLLPVSFSYAERPSSITVPSNSDYQIIEVHTS